MCIGSFFAVHVIILLLSVVVRCSLSLPLPLPAFSSTSLCIHFVRFDFVHIIFTFIYIQPFRRARSSHTIFLFHSSWLFCWKGIPLKNFVSDLISHRSSSSIASQSVNILKMCLYVIFSLDERHTALFFVFSHQFFLASLLVSFVSTLVCRLQSGSCSNRVDGQFMFVECRALHSFFETSWTWVWHRRDGIWHKYLHRCNPEIIHYYLTIKLVSSFSTGGTSSSSSANRWKFPVARWESTSFKVFSLTS